MSLASRAPVHCSFDSEKAGDREVQRTMLELLNQLDGFQPNTQVKVSKENTAQQLADPAQALTDLGLCLSHTLAASC